MLSITLILLVTLLFIIFQIDPKPLHQIKTIVILSHVIVNLVTTARPPTMCSSSRTPLPERLDATLKTRAGEALEG